VAIVAAASGAGDSYKFSPSRLTVQRGGFLAISNKSGEVHTLISAPDAGIVSSVLDKKERQVIQFPRTGTFTVQSADATHRAVMRVTVSGESGCGAPKPTLVIAGAAAGHYSFTPRTLTVTATQNFTVVNKSNVAQTVICTPDPGGNADNSKLDQGETQLLAIDKPGRYVCASVQHSNAKVTITVNDT
jgi:plastocyanin